MNKEKSEGYTAFLYGITDCPYDKYNIRYVMLTHYCPQSENWWKGWYKAEEEDIQSHEEWR